MERKLVTNPDGPNGSRRHRELIAELVRGGAATYGMRRAVAAAVGMRFNGTEKIRPCTICSRRIT
jgi:hypothetical protein